MDEAAGATAASVPLAPFAYDWIGGDIHGLAALAAQLASYVPALTSG